MATNLPPFLINYLLSRGLFSDRFSAQEDTQETPKEEQELTFEKVLQDILDGGLETGDTTSATSATSAPSSTTSSTGGAGLGGIGGLFGDIEQAISDAFSFDLEQAAIDAVQDATGLDLSFQGLFGIEAPSFFSDIQAAAPSTVTSAIMSSPNQSLGAKIGAGLHQGLMSLTPFGLTAFGIGANMMGATDPFDPSKDLSVAYDPYADVTTITPDPKSLGDAEPDVTRSELGMAFDLADLMGREMAGLDRSSIGINTPAGVVAFSPFDFGPMMGMHAPIGPLDPISQLTNAAVDTFDFGGFGPPGAFSSQPDFSSPYGFFTDYHSPEFDPANMGPSFNNPSYDPTTGALDFGFDSGLQGGRSAGKGGPDLDFSIGGPAGVSSFDDGYDGFGGPGDADDGAGLGGEDV